jgi:hypothetical protein
MKLAYDKTDDKRDRGIKVFFCLKYYHLTMHMIREIASSLRFSQ